MAICGLFLALIIGSNMAAAAAPFGRSQQQSQYRSQQQTQQRPQSASSQVEQQKFYEVDALGDDYVDFGAMTGPRGAFSWHATYRLE